MPNARDTLGETPLGAVTRHPIDWWWQSAYTCGFEDLQTSGSFENWYANYFYNADPQGRVAKIYATFQGNDGGGGYTCFYQYGPPPGTLAATAQALRPDQGTAKQYFQFQVQTTATGFRLNPYNATLGPIVGALPQSGFDSDLSISPFPLFIVPVGYSLVLTNNFSAFQQVLVLWYHLSGS